MDKKKLYAIVAVLVLVCGGMGWYFMYYTKTPTYSLNLIRGAVQKHDIQFFKQHVDLDSVLSRAADDCIASTIETDMKLKNNPFNGLAEGFVGIMKPMMVNSLKEEIIKQVEGSANASASPAPQGNTPVDSKMIVQKTGLKDAEFKGFSYEKKDGKIANVGVTVFEAEMAENFTFDIKMGELNDGTWQVVEVTNLKNYLNELDKARKVALKKYDNELQAIQREYNIKWEELKKKYPQLSKESVEAEIVMNKEHWALEEQIEVPVGAEELANLRKERRKLSEEHTSLLKRYVNGERSQEIEDAYKKNIDGLRENGEKIKRIRERIKDIQ